MPVYTFFCEPCDQAFDDFLPLDASRESVCPTCGIVTIQRRYALAGPPKMGAESTPAYQKWFYSEATQAKLRSGEWVIAGKGSDLNND